MLLDKKLPITVQKSIELMKCSHDDFWYYTTISYSHM